VFIYNLKTTTIPLLRASNEVGKEDRHLISLSHISFNVKKT
jgi:hypothetical protein